MANPLPTKNHRTCPDCGAEVPTSATVCWCCRGPLIFGSLDVSQAIDTKGRAPFRFQFTLASIMLIMTFTAILMSIFTMSPGLGVFVLVLAMPALIRTIVLAMQKGSRDQPMTVPAKIGFFLLWVVLVGIVLLVVGAILYVTLFIVCAAGSSSNAVPILVTGGILAFLAAVSLLVLFWRKIEF
jgi:hypothetical protein